MEIQESIKNIKFGHYPQTAKGDILPIEWQVLSKEENKMLVISKYGLEARCFDSRSSNWKKSEIRKWANKEFYNEAFNEEEKKHINSFEGNNVFLLSIDEAEKYFDNDDERMCKATEYAKANGAGVNSYNGYSAWWLRSPRGGLVYSVLSCGFIDYDFVDFANNLFRPALWIKI